MVKQKAMFGQLKQLGPKICFGRPNDNLEQPISDLVFTDAGKPSDGARISTKCGLPMEIFDQNPYNHFFVSDLA